MSSYQNVSDSIETVDESLAIKRIQEIAIRQKFAEARQRISGFWDGSGGRLWWLRCGGQ